MTKLVFVDGPNGVGKDYFIVNLVKLLKESSKTFVVKSIKDYMPEGNLLISTRQFNREFFIKSFYNTDVLDAHIACVNDVIKITEQEEYDYILVNRSIVSYFIYNLIIPKNVINMYGNIDEELDKITGNQYARVDFGLVGIYKKLLETKSQTYLFLLYNNLSEKQNIEIMEEIRGVKFSDFEKLMLTHIFNTYATFYGPSVKQFYYFSTKNIVMSSEYELAYEILESKDNADKIK
jgi:hypothetical protein